MILQNYKNELFEVSDEMFEEKYNSILKNYDTEFPYKIQKPYMEPLIDRIAELVSSSREVLVRMFTYKFFCKDYLPIATNEGVSVVTMWQFRPHVHNLMKELECDDFTDKAIRYAVNMAFLKLQGEFHTSAGAN